MIPVLANTGHAKAALGLFAVGWPRVLAGREFVIESGDLVQSVDDFFVGHCGRVAASPVRFLAEKRGIGRNSGVGQHFIHVDLTLGLHGTIQPFARAYR